MAGEAGRGGRGIWAAKKSPPGLYGRGGLWCWVPGGSLLSHGGPHYHRRWAVSLPRSGWDRVVPARSGHQARLWAAGPPGPAPGPPSRGGSGIRAHVAFGSSGPRPAQAAWALYGQASRAISTGQLHASPRFHTRPINLVVFKGPSGESSSQGGLILGGASRLDAFSGYPVRT